MKDLAIDIGDPADAAASTARQAPPLTVLIQANLAPVRPDKRVRAVALGLALIAHAAVLYVLAHEPEEEMAGSGGQQIDAISVTIVSSKRPRSRGNRTGRSRSLPRPRIRSRPPTELPTASRPPPPSSARRRRRRRSREEKNPEEEPIRTAEAIFEVPKEAQRQRKQEAAAPAGGGAEARSDTASDAKASAPAAASAGAAREYARNVAEALRKTRPKSAGGLGTVRVKFTIAADGERRLRRDCQVERQHEARRHRARGGAADQVPDAASRA